MMGVFISYSRKDTDFVRQLHEALKAHDRDTWVDWEDIPPTAEWWAEVQAGIEASDTFVGSSAGLVIQAECKTIRG